MEFSKNNKHIVEYCQSNKGKHIKCEQTGTIYSIWQIEDIPKKNREFSVQEFLPQYVGIASLGIKYLVAVNLYNGKVISVPFIPMDIDSSIELADNIDNLTIID
ncbi:MAG: hypothetical protein JXR48_13190 [Candidatus Delongbacteria bacterium]|nr:hypothetical protein [Candidatus Delongbacteria bacterium]MBN2835909.1 hypothetical protein [Candidatus Delongbacteria bacterium]